MTATIIQPKTFSVSKYSDGVVVLRVIDSDGNGVSLPLPPSVVERIANATVFDEPSGFDVAGVE